MKLYKAGDAEAFDELMKKTEGLRITLAQRYLNIPGSEFEDLMSEGAMEMLSAIQNFDSEKSEKSLKPVTVISWWVETSHRLSPVYWLISQVMRV